jgi:hypothetical protein
MHRGGIGAVSSVFAGCATVREAVDAGIAVALPPYAGEDLPRAATALSDVF